MNVPFNVLTQARGAETRALAALRAQGAEVNRLRAQADAEREAAARLRRERDAEDVSDLLAGVAHAEGPDAGAQAERRAAIADKAAEVLEAKRPALAAAVRSAEETVKGATVLAYLAQRGAAQEEALAAVQGLVAPLAALLAAEQVRATLAPAPFVVPDGVDPQELWSASFAVNAFLKALPPRLRPEGFTELVSAEASRLAAVTLSATGGKDA